jgi:hypothetical protein
MFFSSERLPLVHEKHVSASPLVESDMTMEKRKVVVKDQIVTFPNGCPK